MNLSNPASTNSFFTAKDIAEPLVSVTKDESDRLSKLFNDDNFDVVGFNENERVTGFLDKQDTSNLEELSNRVKKFEIHDLITSNTDLKDCLLLLESRQQLFIIDKSHISGIVTRSDRQKPAVRMLFFGMITVFESELATLINLKYPDNAWKTLITETRYSNAEEQFSELVEKNLEVSLINCTQFCDKTNIVVNDPELLTTLTESSKKQAKKVFKQVQRLRDDLAHAQSLQYWFENKEVMTLINQISFTTEKIKEKLK